MTVASSTAALYYGANERRHVMLEKLGGRAVLQQAVNTFYDKQVADDRLMVFFRKADLQILKWHQFNLMSIAFSSVPENFDVEHLLLNRHQRLFDDGLDASHFDIVMTHFQTTLEEMSIDKELIAEAMEVIQPVRYIFETGAEQAKQRRQAQQYRAIGTWSIMAILVAVGLSRIVVRSSKH